MSGEREREAGALALTARRLLDDLAALDARASRAADQHAGGVNGRLYAAAESLHLARARLAEATFWLESCAGTVPAAEADTDRVFTDLTTGAGAGE
jgi:hypothetical protein